MNFNVEPSTSTAPTAVNRSQGTTVNDCDTLIIGAGAAGLMCASVAGQLGSKVVLIDHAERIGEKIRISGGGRSNFTNRTVTAENFVSANPHFSKSALSQYKSADFVALVERYGIAYHEKHKGQLFCDGSSQQIVDMLLEECAIGKVDIQPGCSVESLGRIEAAGGQGDGFIVNTSRGQLRTRHLVVATGGLSIPKIGASDFGYRIARQFGHKIVETVPALVPLTFDATTLPSLPGLSLPVRISCASRWANRKGQQAFLEDMLFTHRGLSGPAILQISTYRDGKEALNIDLSPDQSLWDMLKSAKTSSRQNLNQVLATVFPKRLVEAMVPLELGSKRIAEVPDQSLRDLAQSLHELKVMPTGSEGYQKAEVTRGGVDTSEVHQATMESKRVPGLFFVGEVLDVTGWLGGYNFQWAWSSATACGREIGRRCALFATSARGTADLSDDEVNSSQN